MTSVVHADRLFAWLDSNAGMGFYRVSRGRVERRCVFHTISSNMPLLIGKIRVMGSRIAVIGAGTPKYDIDVGGFRAA